MIVEVMATSWDGAPMNQSIKRTPTATTFIEVGSGLEDDKTPAHLDQEGTRSSLRNESRGVSRPHAPEAGCNSGVAVLTESSRGGGAHRIRRRSGSRDGAADKCREGIPNPARAAPMCWERQGSSMHIQHQDCSAGNGDSSDTLGVDSDDDELNQDEEMVAALAAAAAAAASTPGEGSSEGLKREESAIPLPEMVSRLSSRSSAPQASVVVPSLVALHEVDSYYSSSSARATRASSLSHSESVNVPRERSQQLYVPMPAAISRTFGESNNAMIDRRAWLEVEDRKHRYAKNLRLYYKEWDRRGQPGSSFWSWLDEERVELEECSRAQLEAETVYYCSFTKDREAFEVQFDEHGLLHQGQAGAWDLVETGPDGWIFVLRDGLVYAHEKKTDQPPRFHHSSFFAGECVQAAGLFVATGGVLERLYPHSGHYRPSDSHLLSLLLFLEAQHVDMAVMQVDVQLVMKVARSHDATKGGRRRKIDSPYMWTGLHAKYFLLAKRYAWDKKLFDEMLRHRLCLCPPGT